MFFDVFNIFCIMLQGSFSKPYKANRERTFQLHVFLKHAVSGKLSISSTFLWQVPGGKQGEKSYARQCEKLKTVHLTQASLN